MGIPSHVGLLLTYVTPLIKFLMWVEMVLTVASSLRLPNHLSMRMDLPSADRAISTDAALKFLVSVPRLPLTVTTR